MSSGFISDNHIPYITKFISFYFLCSISSNTGPTRTSTSFSWAWVTEFLWTSTFVHSPSSFSRADILAYKSAWFCSYLISWCLRVVISCCNKLWYSRIAVSLEITLNNKAVVFSSIPSSVLLASFYFPPILNSIVGKKIYCRDEKCIVNDWQSWLTQHCWSELNVNRDDCIQCKHASKADLDSDFVMALFDSRPVARIAPLAPPPHLSTRPGFYEPLGCLQCQNEW